MQNLRISIGDQEKHADVVFYSLSNLTTWTKYERLFSANRHPFQDIFYWIYYAIALLFIRYTANRCVFSPIAIWLGIKTDKFPKSPPTNILLEKTFHKSDGNVSDKQITGLVKQLDLSEREIRRWLRQRARQNRQSLISKFNESAWRFSYYSFQLLYGIYTLWDKPWFWNSDYLFTDHPNQHVSSGEWWYYTFEASFYISLLISQFFDVKRKDFWVMFVHHIITLTLISYSWIENFVQIGTMVIVIHDFADVPLELSKLLLYLKKSTKANITFGVFTLCWVISRLVAFPCRILYYSLAYYPPNITNIQYYGFNCMLLILQVLHLIWTGFIARMAITVLQSNELKDSRSDDEADDADDDDIDECEL